MNAQAPEAEKSNTAKPVQVDTDGNGKEKKTPTLLKDYRWDAEKQVFLHKETGVEADPLQTASLHVQVSYEVGVARTKRLATALEVFGAAPKQQERQAILDYVAETYGLRHV